MKKELKALVLFAGCGGDTLGLERAGFETVGFVENEKAAIKTYNENFPGVEHVGREHDGGNIRKIPDEEFEKFKGEVDVITAGFPCQGFSHAGKKDPEDPRNELFWEFKREVKLVEPDWIIGENVFGLVHRKTDDGEAFVSDVIVNAFKNIGYNMAEPVILSATKFGVPQKRRRVFFIGNKNGIEFNAQSLKNKKSKETNIEDIVKFTLEDAVPFDPEMVEGEIETYCESEGYEEPFGGPHPYLLQKMKEGKLSYSKRLSPHHTEVVDLKAPAKTIHCGYKFQPRLFVPLKNRNGTFLRTFTVRELAQIQGFPEGFDFCGDKQAKIDQIGNAVPPQMVEGIIREINKNSQLGLSTGGKLRRGRDFK